MILSLSYSVHFTWGCINDESFFLLERFNRSCVNVIDVKVKKPLKTSYFMHYFPIKPRGSITCLQKPFQVSSRYFLSHPQCSPHKTVTSWATSWGATAWSGGRIALDEMMKGNKTSRQMRQKICKWNIKEWPWVRKWRCREAELLGLILIQIGKITGGWIEPGPLQLPPRVVPVNILFPVLPLASSHTQTHILHCHVLLTVPLLSVSLLEHNVFL